jgi:hypothetical protein
MTETEQGPDKASGDSAVVAVDEEIRREALRQLESIDCDDDDWRIEPLPSFEPQPTGDEMAHVPDSGVPASEDVDDINPNDN